MDDEIRYQATVEVPGGYGLHGLTIITEYSNNPTRTAAPISIKVDANDNGLKILENLVDQIKKQRDNRDKEFKKEVVRDLDEMSGYIVGLTNHMDKLAEKLTSNATDGLTGIRYTQNSANVVHLSRAATKLVVALSNLPS